MEVITSSGARARTTYRKMDRSVTVRISTGVNALWRMFTVADFNEILGYLKNEFDWLTEEKLYLQVPPSGVESFGFGPCLIFFIPDDHEEPVGMPRD